MENIKEKCGYIFFTLLALLFLALPFYSSFVKDDFQWLISQTLLWNDAKELLIYFGLILISSFFAKNRKGIIVLVVSSIYLLSTGTLQQCFVSYIYIEIILLIGRSFLSLFERDKKYTAGINFLAGSLIWGFFAIILSLLKCGTIDELRIFTAVLLLLAVINPRNTAAYDDILLVKYIKYINGNSQKEFLLNLFLIIIMLISCARVNFFRDYDSVWYALYPEKCLFGDNSFYDFLGYTEFVYYYPKFKELLMAPISGLKLEGYLNSSNLWIMLLCAVEVKGFLTDNIRNNKKHILGVVYLVFSTVCIVGISGTAKSDTMSYLYILLLVIYFAKYLKNGESTELWIAVSAGIMSYTVKYTSFLWSTLIFIIMFIMLMYLLVSKKIKIQVPNAMSIVLVLFACFIFGGIIYRTYRLTGYPTYGAGKSLWETLGYCARPYFDNDGSSTTVFNLSRLYSTFFDVKHAEKIAFQWTGNYTLFFLICFFVLFRKKQKNMHKFIMYVAIVVFAVSLYFLVTMEAPDGNYFSIGIIVGTCYIFIRMTECTRWNEQIAIQRWFSMVMTGFMLLNLLFVFLTHPSCGMGIRFSSGQPFSSMYISEAEKFNSREISMKQYSIYEINEWLQQSTDGKDFILSDGVSAMCMLEARVEPVAGVFNRYLSGANINNYEEFLEYIDYVGVTGFIVAWEDSECPAFVEYVNRYIDENGCIEQIGTDRYYYYKIK